MTLKENFKSGIWLYFYQLIIIIPVSFLFLTNIGIENSFLSFLFILTSALSHFGILSFVLFIVFYLPFSLLISKKILVNIFSIAISSLGIFTLLLDSYVFKLYRFHINKFTLSLVFGKDAGQIFEFDWKLYGYIFCVLAIIIIIESFYHYLFFKFQKQICKRGITVFIGLVLCLLISNITHALGVATFKRSITKYSHVYPLFFPLRASRFLYKHNIVSSENSDYNIDKYAKKGNDIINYPLHTIKTDSLATNLNVLIIAIDSWNSKAFSKDITPNINKFAPMFSKFNHHYSGSNGTRTGIFSLFYGIPGLYWYDFLDLKKSPIVMDEFIKRGYTPGIFTSASLANPPFDKTVFSNIKDLQIKSKGKTSAQRDLDITKSWLSFIDKHDKKDPFFGFVFYDAPHGFSLPDNFEKKFKPSWPYAKYQDLNNNTDPTEFFNLYLNCVNYNDSLVGRILEDLKQKGLFENTIVIITGDHSQEFNENNKNYWGHNGNYSKAQLGVAMLIHWPGKPVKEYNHWSSHYDIVPTIMQDLFSCSNNISDYSIGDNIFSKKERKWLVVGSQDNFGILEKDRITTVKFDMSYEITDHHLNTISNAKLRVNLFKQILDKVNIYRK